MSKYKKKKVREKIEEEKFDFDGFNEDEKPIVQETNICRNEGCSAQAMRTTGVCLECYMKYSQDKDVEIEY